MDGRSLSNLKTILGASNVEAYEFLEFDYSSRPYMPAFEMSKIEEVVRSKISSVNKLVDGVPGWSRHGIRDPYPDDYRKSLAAFNMYLDGVFNSHSEVITQHKRYFFIFADDNLFTVVSKK